MAELTITNLGGFQGNIEKSSMKRIFETWDLRKSWFLTTPQSGWRRVYAEILRKYLDQRHASG